ncbi:hypothetical protein B0H14DRAFT_3435635 [Mycena olivaceomarginata]|nr:hypothetical protein B0H14DRAFT_3435635 [Mycena olivaceomarginata]
MPHHILSASYYNTSGQCRANAQRQHRAPRPLLSGTSPVGSLATQPPRNPPHNTTFFTRLFRSLLLCFCPVLPLYRSGINSIFVPHRSLYATRITDPLPEPTGRAFHPATPSTREAQGRSTLRPMPGQMRTRRMRRRRCLRCLLPSVRALRAIERISSTGAGEANTSVYQNSAAWRSSEGVEGVDGGYFPQPHPCPPLLPYHSASTSPPRCTCSRPYTFCATSAFPVCHTLLASSFCPCSAPPPFGVSLSAPLSATATAAQCFPTTAAPTTTSPRAPSPAPASVPLFTALQPLCSSSSHLAHLPTGASSPIPPATPRSEPPRPCAHPPHPGDPTR